jgi:hypothetical protein
MVWGEIKMSDLEDYDSTHKQNRRITWLKLLGSTLLRHWLPHILAAGLIEAVKILGSRFLY